MFDENMQTKRMFPYFLQYERKISELFKMDKMKNKGVSIPYALAHAPQQGFAL
ncbi:hypothetical protein [Paenibacillus agricola]|uniref:Uncharacterized protein n=1 Tax=Paenibacillus agricola TaxID=2716264 RepID=A0ABX0JAB3_9BACL|nr:hypothetical protein [Paenibacillus agricola]NHN30690.1 hypothetical protein [Paenibacillus agricola]